MIDENRAIEAYINTPKTVDFYKEAFSKYTISGIEKFSWQWSWWAMFGGMFYLLYRKLYLEALAYFLLFATVGMIPVVGLVLWILSGAVLPFLVYKRYKKTKTQVEENISNEEEQLHALQELGGVNKWAIWLGVAVHAFLWAGMLYSVILLSAMPPIGIQ